MLINRQTSEEHMFSFTITFAAVWTICSVIVAGMYFQLCYSEYKQGVRQATFKFGEILFGVALGPIHIGAILACIFAK